MAFVLSGISILHCLPWFWIAKGGAEDGGISGRKRLLETTRRATIGNQHPRASRTRAPSAAAGLAGL
jgi:hypothetical protein